MKNIWKPIALTFGVWLIVKVLDETGYFPRSRKRQREVKKLCKDAALVAMIERQNELMEANKQAMENFRKRGVYR